MIFKKQKNKKIYLDYAASTPLDKEVFRVITKSLKEDFMNPSAVYERGFSLRQKIEQVRNNISQMIACLPREIIFTEGGSEANNLALSGFIHAFWKEYAKKPLIITSRIEHSSILETLKYWKEQKKIDLVYIPVSSSGVIDFSFFKKILREEKPDLISIGYVNGEIGLVQDIRQISKMIRHHRKHQKRNFPFFHVDAVQAVNYCDCNTQRLGVDMMTINASKIYGPKKIAALYKNKKIVLDSLVLGGDQEFSYRAGTENISYILGFEKALEQALVKKDSEIKRLSFLRDFFEQELVKRIKNIVINGKDTERIPNISNISIPNLSSEEILIRLDAVGVEISVKSACKSDEVGDSHVILSLRSENTQSLRFSFGRETTKRDLIYVLDKLECIIFDMQKTYNKYITK